MTDQNNHSDIDDVTGIETTGHEWDGLKELNNPLPKWWLYLMYASIAWSLVYFVLYPSWPTPGGATEGTLGYTQYKELAASQEEIRQRQAEYLVRFQQASYAEIQEDEQLYAFGIRGGASAFKDNCATCHGSGATGFKGYPNLIDDAWLWGGSIDAIEQTIRYGIRSSHDETRISEMPAFGRDEILSREEITDVVSHVLSFSDKSTIANENGATLYLDNCASCHGDYGKGLEEFGAPDLTDAIWLYGGDRDTITQTVINARYGVMPHWTGRLSEVQIRSLALYVHQLGGATGLGLQTAADLMPEVEAKMAVSEGPAETENAAITNGSAEGGAN